MAAVKAWVRRGVVGAAVLVAGVLLFTTFQGDQPGDQVVRGAVLDVFPERGTVALRQGAIGVDLAFGYTATLSIDSVSIPDDQLDTLAGINRVSFSPGPGKEIESLAEGRHCATVTYSATDAAEASARGSNMQPFTWCFTAA